MMLFRSLLLPCLLVGYVSCIHISHLRDQILDHSESRVETDVHAGTMIRALIDQETEIFLDLGARIGAIQSYDTTAALEAQLAIDCPTAANRLYHFTGGDVKEKIVKGTTAAKTKLKDIPTGDHYIISTAALTKTVDTMTGWKVKQEPKGTWTKAKNDELLLVTAVADALLLNKNYRGGDDNNHKNYELVYTKDLRTFFADDQSLVFFTSQRIPSTTPGDIIVYNNFGPTFVDPNSQHAKVRAVLAICVAGASQITDPRTRSDLLGSNEQQRYSDQWTLSGGVGKKLRIASGSTLHWSSDIFWGNAQLRTEISNGAQKKTFRESFKYWDKSTWGGGNAAYTAELAKVR